MFSEALSSHTFTLPFKPVKIMLDINEKVSDATLDNYKIIRNLKMYDFKETRVKIHISSLKSQIFLRAVLNCISPEKTKFGDYTLSRKQYWTLESVVHNFKGDALFYVNTSENGFDTPVEKLKLLHRKDLKSDWKPVKFILKRKNKNSAYFVVENFKLGDYIIAKQ